MFYFVFMRVCVCDSYTVAVVPETRLGLGFQLKLGVGLVVLLVVRDAI